MVNHFFTTPKCAPQHAPRTFPVVDFYRDWCIHTVPRPIGPSVTILAKRSGICMYVLERHIKTICSLPRRLQENRQSAVHITEIVPVPYSFT
jgi:hypothetical protein